MDVPRYLEKLVNYGLSSFKVEKEYSSIKIAHSKSVFLDSWLRVSYLPVAVRAVAVFIALLYPEKLLPQDQEIEEIIVKSTRVRRSFDNQVSRVQILGAEELNEKSSMRPGEIRMLLNESTGIHVQQTSASSFNSTIRIQGLDGKYTQILRDSMPLFGGYSGGLGLLQVAPLDLQQVEIIKGSSSTLHGGGAIAGMINLISKVPSSEPEASILLNSTSAGGFDVSGFFSNKGEALGGTLLTSYNSSEAYDLADSGLSAIPEYERWTVNPRLFFEGQNSVTRIGLNGVKEERIGGSLNYIDGRRLPLEYFEKNDTTRVSSQFEHVRQLSSGSEITILNSVSSFKRSLGTPGSNFSGTQLSSFSEAHILGSNHNFEWALGANFLTEDFDQENRVPGFNHDLNKRTFGIFSQATRSLTEEIALEVGMRVDNTSLYGTLAIPHISLIYNLSAQTTFRIGGGAGYKEPTVFTEESESRQFRNILSLDYDLIRPERSSGVNADLNHVFEFSNGASVNLNVLLFYTKVNDPLHLEAQGLNQFSFSQAYDYLDTRGSEINMAWRRDNFKLFLGYTHTDVNQHDLKGAQDYPLVPRDRLNTVLVYEREDDIRIGLEAYYYGEQGLRSKSRSRDFWIFGLMIEKMFKRDWSFFLNFENFSDTRQSRYEPIFTGTLANPLFGDIYAPVDGFVVNGGIKLTF